MPLLALVLGTLIMTALTAAGWYSVSILVGGPAFDVDKMPAVMCGWSVLLTVIFTGLFIALES